VYNNPLVMLLEHHHPCILNVPDTMGEKNDFVRHPTLSTLKGYLKLDFPKSKLF